MVNVNWLTNKRSLFQFQSLFWSVGMSWLAVARSKARQKPAHGILFVGFLIIGATPSLRTNLAKKPSNHVNEEGSLQATKQSSCLLRLEHDAIIVGTHRDMNDKIDEHDVHNSIESPSSSSSDSSTTSATTTSSDSTSSNGGQSTIIKQTISSPSDQSDLTADKRDKMDTDSSSSSGSASNSAATITSTESVRRYKNSPFGLNHHYLTMPDSNSDVPILSSSNNMKDQRQNRAGRREWKKKNKQQSAGMRTNHDPYRDLSILAPLSAVSQSSLSSPSWPQDYETSRLGGSAKNHNQLNSANDVRPAFDAGLDAKKCNSKQLSASSSYFCQDDTITNSASSRKQQIADAAADDDKSSSSYQDYDRLLVRFSSIMYATFLVILGCILHCSELRQKSKNSTDHIYTIVVALMGIAWLLFLQGDLQRYKRYASRYILIESIFNDQKQKMRKMAAASSSSSSAASFANDRMSMNTEVIFKKTAYKMYQRRAAAALNGHHNGAGSSVGKLTSNLNENYSSSDLPQSLKSSGGYFATNSGGENHEKIKASSTSYLEEDNEDEGRGGVVDNIVPAYKFLHGKMGANFYLKCGMAAFCFGHVIHEGLRFGQQLYFFGTGNVHCRDLAALIAHLITPLYSFYQLFMMFKYSNLVINRHRVLAKFGLMHIVGTSITFWIRTILEEAYEDFVHKMDYFKSNKLQNMVLSNMSNPMDTSGASSGTVAALGSLSSAIIWPEASEHQSSMVSDQNVTVAQTILALMSSPISATITPQIVRHLPESYACAQNTLLTTKSMNALPYLYPFTIEYNLLLAATFLSLYFNIGKIGSHGTGGCQPFTTRHSRHDSGDLKRTGTKRQLGSSFSNSPVSHQTESSDNLSTLKVTRKDLGEYKSNFVVNADCHSANKGLFCGFFVLLVTLVTIVIFFVTINKPTHVQLGIKINLIQEGVLTTLILIVMIIAFKQVSKLNRSPSFRDKVTTDDVLMLIPLPFFFFHSLLSFRAETASLYQSEMMHSQRFGHEPVKIHEIRISSSNDRSANVTNLRSAPQINRFLSSRRNMSNGQLIENFINNTSDRTDISGDDHNNRKGRGSSNINAGNDSSQIDHFKLINVALNIVVMIEVLVQTNFIIDGMRRCSESRYLRFKKPGRELITFAILLNITYWIVATFETKSVEQYKPEIEYYGPLPYMFISHTTLPVMLFYRYHSSVCLAEIWNRAYKPPKGR